MESKPIISGTWGFVFLDGDSHATYRVSSWKIYERWLDIEVLGFVGMLDSWRFVLPIERLTMIQATDDQEWFGVLCRESFSIRQALRQSEAEAKRTDAAGSDGLTTP